MTPSSRVSAINIVGDLLRKVGVSQINILSTLLKVIVVIIVVLFTLEYLIYWRDSIN